MSIVPELELRVNRKLPKLNLKVMLEEEHNNNNNENNNNAYDRTIGQCRHHDNYSIPGAVGGDLTKAVRGTRYTVHSTRPIHERILAALNRR